MHMSSLQKPLTNTNTFTKLDCLNQKFREHSQIPPETVRLLAVIQNEAQNH